jgi:glycosyltransferase involved in cell wall biosynthesis
MTVYFGASERNTEDPLISIVVPALNEALNLSVVLPQLPRVHEVILVDGGSVDGTVMAARRALPEIVTVLQDRGGKGNALAAGFARVTGDIVVMFDADGSADPAEIGRFVEALKAGADFAKGSRFTAGRGSADTTTVRGVANRLLNGVFNLGFGTRCSDLCYGYNAF